MGQYGQPEEEAAQDRPITISVDAALCDSGFLNADNALGFCFMLR